MITKSTLEIAAEAVRVRIAQNNYGSTAEAMADITALNELKSALVKVA